MKRAVISSRVLRISSAIATGVLLSVSLLRAQVDTGTVLGTVTDASRAVLRGAEVTLTNEGTSAKLTTTAGPDGTYKFTPVGIGTYSLTAFSQGFQTTTQHGVTVNVAASVVVDFKLNPSLVSETVEVTSTPSGLETQDASVGQVINSRNVNNLPLNGRNFTFLARFAAGVNSPQADFRGNAASGAFAANGLRPAQNNYLLDGIDNNSDTVDFLNGTNFVVLPPVDAIQEFKIQTTGFSAEFGRSGAAVLNATTKSGTNDFHGALWEFFRNDKLDARDFFEHLGVPKGAYRLNQFGFSAGGPVIKNKIFFFADYEGLRRRQGTILTGTVPTVLERNSSYSNFTDLITLQGGSARSDALGRQVPLGTILDPATTRPVTAGQVDPVSGLIASTTGFVRDPFSTCWVGTTDFTGANVSACSLNKLPAGRLDANAIRLLNLYPLPTNSALFQNFANSPALKEDRNSFDSRSDLNLSQKDQMFFRFSLVDDPQLIPGIFGGVADGGSFQQGNQTALAQQSALSWTHVFAPAVINVARVGLNYLHTARVSPAANDLSDIPGQFGIQGIPQAHENGGLPSLVISGLNTLGGSGFRPSDEVSSAFQVTDDFTKIYGKHTFKMGFEFQHVKFSTLQPPASRGGFIFDGVYTDIPNVGGGNTGRAQFLLVPASASVANGVDYVGGPNGVFLSNISSTDNGKNYYGGYVNDDWKVTPKLTVNLGLRWDFFGLVFERHANQANFVPRGPPTGTAMYLIPPGPNSANLSASFITLLAQDSIALKVTDAYGHGLGRSQKGNFAPRVGFAYQITPAFVARAGFGVFYNGFENRGYTPNLGQNYPFQFQFGFFRPDDNHPIVYTDSNGAPCSGSSVGPIGNATLETGFSCTPLDPLLVNANGLQLRGIQFHYATPYSMGGNFALQYAVTSSLSVQAGYVTTLARHLEVGSGSNHVSQILPASANADDFKPFKDFARDGSQATTDGNSSYHGLQVTVEKTFARGLNFLGTYTWSKTRSDAGDLLNTGSTLTGGYRAPSIPGFGIQGDYGLANFDIRNVFHFSGGYELPLGKGRRFVSGSRGLASKLAGGWSVMWSSTFQGGQPIDIPCPTPTTAGTNCGALFTGQRPTSGSHNVTQFLNPAAFNQPCVLGTDPNNPNGPPIPIPDQPRGCVPLTGLGALGGSPTQVAGPGFSRVDLSIFRDIRFTDRFRLQFRAEFFNILNHPNFNAPGFDNNNLDFKNPNFGQISSTRDAPNNPRQIQFALKLYY